MKGMTLFTACSLLIISVIFGYLRLDDDIQTADVNDQETSDDDEEPLQEESGSSLNIDTSLEDEFSRFDVDITEERTEEEVNQPITPTNVEVQNNVLTFHAVEGDYIVGYRIYRSDDGENYGHVESISMHDRKRFVDSKQIDASYFVTTVDQFGQESDPSDAN